MKSKYVRLMTKSKQIFSIHYQNRLISENGCQQAPLHLSDGFTNFLHKETELVKFFLCTINVNNNNFVNFRLKNS